jgi:hypothetical protein
MFWYINEIPASFGHGETATRTQMDIDELWAEITIYHLLAFWEPTQKTKIVGNIIVCNISEEVKLDQRSKPMKRTK